MGSINRVLLIGNLTRDPELKSVGETSVCEFAVAVNERRKVDGEWTEVASFFDVVAFGSQAEACATHLAKGRKVGVDGKLRQERWKDRETQQNRSRVRVVADSVQFLSDGKPAADGEPDWRDAAPADEAPI